MASVEKREFEKYLKYLTLKARFTYYTMLLASVFIRTHTHMYLMHTHTTRTYICTHTHLLAHAQTGSPGSGSVEKRKPSED